MLTNDEDYEGAETEMNTNVLARMSLYGHNVLDEDVPAEDTSLPGCARQVHPSLDVLIEDISVCFYFRLFVLRYSCKCSELLASIVHVFA